MNAHWKRVAVRWGYWLCPAVVCAGVILFVVERALAQGVPDPILTITLVSTNQVQLVITNGVSTANYEIHRRQFFDPAYPWKLHLIGAQGQTNFTANLGVDTIGFFGATAGLDWDQDGVPNWADGNPISTNVGILSITIDSPTAGSTFN